MIKYFRYLLIVLFFVPGLANIEGQEPDPGLADITHKFSQFCRSVPFEDIYIHTDRDVYIAGEYLWFSTYLFDRQNSSLSSRSSYAYIELLNPVNQPVAQVKVRLENGTGGNCFILPDTLSNGEYTLRAYTSWMKNFLPNGCFMKKITLYNLFSEKNFAGRDMGKPGEGIIPVIQFFPEGGRIMGGFINRVGLRASNKDGRGRSCKGFILDLLSDTLTSVQIDSTGIGSFEFVPQTGKSYVFKTDDSKGTFNLPVIYSTGYSIHVNYSEKNFLEININHSEISSPRDKAWIYLIIQSHGQILYSNKIILQGKSTGINIPTVTLRPGLNQITILDPFTRPVCDRYVYKPSGNAGSIVMKSGDRFGKRKKITLEIDPGIRDLSADLSDFSLSVSASDANYKSSSISDYLILGNEFILPGKPGSSPLEFSNSPAGSIDDLLLSLKSNWIDWRTIMSDSIPVMKYNFEKKGQYLSGIIKSQNKSETNYQKLVFLSAPGKIPVFKYAVVERENRFSFFIKDFENMKDLVIQPADFKGSYSIIIESPFSQRYPGTMIETGTSGISFPEEVLKWSVNYQVGKIYGISPVNDTIMSDQTRMRPIRFYGKPDLELKMKDYISLPVMQEIFFELVPGVIVRTRKSKYGLFMLDPVSKKENEIMPTLLVDGVVVDDPASILDLDPELVEEIDVINSEYIVGSVKLSGIINVITKAGDFSSVSLPRNAVRYTFKDHDLSYKFKVPDYSSDVKKNARIPDFRNTLYWDSGLKPDKNGKIQIEIPASDFVSDYIINFQGVAGDRLFSIRKTIRVE